MDQVKSGRTVNRCLGGLAAVFLAAILLSLVWAPAALGKPQKGKEAKETSQFIAYYFFTNQRCASCLRIEQWAQEAVTRNFEDEIKSGRLQWRPVNIQQEENEHFIQDFQLFTKSVIIAEYRDGKPVRWENLQDVWQLLRDKPKYLAYVAGGIKAFMEKK